MIGKKTMIKKHKDNRGLLIAINHILFETKRIFTISDVPLNSVRENLFSKTSDFLYMVIRDACKVELDDENNTEIYKLEAGDVLLFSKRTWMKLSDFLWDTILYALADKEYESSDYVANYKEFRRIAREDNV